MGKINFNGNDWAIVQFKTINATEAAAKQRNPRIKDMPVRVRFDRSSAVYATTAGRDGPALVRSASCIKISNIAPKRSLASLNSAVVMRGYRKTLNMTVDEARDDGSMVAEVEFDSDANALRAIARLHKNGVDKYEVVISGVY